MKMPIIIQLSSSQSANVICLAVDETGEIVRVQLDPFCPVCNLRNEPGYNYCANCGTKLRLASKSTTRPLPQAPYSAPEQYSLPMIDLHQPAAPCVSGYEELSEPNESNQQKHVSLCGAVLREIIGRMNLLQYLYNLSPAKKGAGMQASRFQALSETKDLVLQLNSFITTLLTEEFKSKR
jgi:hypothetical protein